jgi:hypothetical protein
MYGTLPATGPIKFCLSTGIAPTGSKVIVRCINNKSFLTFAGSWSSVTHWALTPFKPRQYATTLTTIGVANIEIRKYSQNEKKLKLYTKKKITAFIRYIRQVHILYTSIDCEEGQEITTYTRKLHLQG